MKFYYLIITLFLTSYSYSQHEDFASIGKSADGIAFSYKIDSDGYDNGWGIWLKAKYPSKKTKSKNGKIINKQQGYQLSYIVFHCDTKLHDTLEYYIYDNKGSVIEQGNYYNYGMKIVPDSTASYLFDVLCGY